MSSSERKTGSEHSAGVKSGGGAAGRTAPARRRTRALLAAALLPLLAAGCGFTPVYGDSAATDVSQPAQDQLSHVTIDLIPDRVGQILRNHLIDQFYRATGRPAESAAHLAIQLNSYKENLGIQRDATATRSRLRVIATVNLMENGTNRVLYHTQIRSLVSYDISQAQYSTLVTEEDAYERALDEISHEVTMRLALYFDRDKKA